MPGRPRSLALPAAVALALAGCAVGPRYQPPATPPTAAGGFVSTDGASAAAQPTPPLWWRLYQDPILDRLVGEALTENNDLKAAAANLAYAQGLLTEARAGRFPTTDLYASPAYEHSNATKTNTTTYGATFVAAYQVDLFGRVTRTIQAAKANAEATQDTQDAVRVTVAAETAQAYADICGYGRQVAVAKSSLSILQQTYDLTVTERNAGALSDFDVDREGVLLEQARAAVPVYEGERRVALFTLAALIGRTPAQIPSDAAACVTPPRLSQPLPVGDGAALLRRRPDVRQAERQLAAATARIGVATADLYPTITLAGSVSSAAGTLSGVFTRGAVSYGAGPTNSATPSLITWTFPNISLARAHIREARAQASSALASFDSTVLTALKETEQALATYAGELAHNAALGAARDRADEALKLANVQYQSGSFNFLDLLTAQATAVNADQALAASDQSLSRDQVAVFQALGGGWEDAPRVTPPALAK